MGRHPGVWGPGPPQVFFLPQFPGLPVGAGGFKLPSKLWKTINMNVIAVITAADIKSHDGLGVSGPPLMFSCRPGFST